MSTRIKFLVLTGVVVLVVIATQVIFDANRLQEEQPGTVLVTGANSGMGLRFCRQYAADGWTVIATHRRDEVPETLQALSDQYPNVMIERMDVQRHDEIDALATKMQGIPIDVLINNAGVSYTGSRPDAETFGTLDYDLIDLFVRTNSIGPVKVAEAFFANVAASSQKKIVNISSSAGSVTWSPENSNGMWYRMSKAALNSLMVSVVPAAKEAGITVVMFHPGWVRFDVQAETRPGQILPEESVAAMIETISDLTLDDTGRFLTRDGKTQPW